MTMKHFLSNPDRYVQTLEPDQVPKTEAIEQD